MNQTPSFRRDPRVNPPPGTAFVEFDLAEPDGRPRRGEVVMVGSTGLGFVLDADPGFGVGSILPAARVEVGGEVIVGDVSVRYVRSTDDSRIEAGCLFYPASLEGTTRWLDFAEQPADPSAPSKLRLPMRCSNCQRVVRLSDARGASRHCPACNQEYLFGDRLRGDLLEDLHRRARRMGQELEVDLPSAVSISLGVLTLSEVRDLLGDLGATVAPGPVPNKRRERGIDPAFGPAIEAGTLTRMQATQRGGRESFAMGLVGRHLISLDDAYAVADNRTPLLHAIRKRAAGGAVKTRSLRPMVSSRFASIAGSTVLLLLALSVVLNQHNGTTDHSPVRDETESDGSVPEQAGIAPARLPTPAPGAEVVLDSTGQLTQIRASRPEAVLREYCEKLGRAPLTLATGVIQDPNLWLGVHQEDPPFGPKVAIAIRKDRATGRWTAGDGASPIQVLTPDPAYLGQTHDLIAADPHPAPSAARTR